MRSSQLTNRPLVAGAGQDWVLNAGSGRCKLTTAGHNCSDVL